MVYLIGIRSIRSRPVNGFDFYLNPIHLVGYGKGYGPHHATSQFDPIDNILNLMWIMVEHQNKHLLFS